VRVPEPLPFAKYPGRVVAQWKAIYNVSERLANVLGLIFGALLVIMTTFELAGKVPPTGIGSIIPPAVIAAFAVAIKVELVQLKFVNELEGQDTVADKRFSEDVPT
jgi:hypothetical protein